MKKIALASAIALASISAAHAAPTVYGKVLLTGEYNNTDYEDNAKKLLLLGIERRKQLLAVTKDLLTRYS